MNSIKEFHFLILFLFLVICIANPFLLITEPAKSWSGNTHGWLSEVAIRLMPSPWNDRLMNHIQFFYDHSDEPDVIRSQLKGSNWEDYMKEAPRHYVDADVRPYLYGNATHHPQPEFNTTYNPDDPRKSSDYQLGVVPWAVENWTIQLSEDLLMYDWDSDKILMDMCMLAHYVQDSWMPFHAVSYYDGQKVPASGSAAGTFYEGGQEGIHSNIERTLIEIFYDDEIQEILDSVTGKAQNINPYMASLRGILTGQMVADEILDVVNVLGYTYDTNAWFQAVWDLTGGSKGNLTKRLINASIETANVWYTAFEDAGLIGEEISITTTIKNLSTTTSSRADFTVLEFITLIFLTIVSILKVRRRRK